MIRNLLFSVFMLSITVAQSQEKVTLNGYVKDADNGEELIGVNIYIPQLKAGTVTNDYGFYALTVPKGTYEVQYSYIGYQAQTITLELTPTFPGTFNYPATEGNVIEEKR